MARTPRVDVGDVVSHVIHRANGRQQIFKTEKDYRAFEKVLYEAVEKFGMRLLAYCIMPNHWHLVIWPREDGDMGRFMQWLTITHTQRYHVHRGTVGTGHIYQGRYKAFIVETEAYLARLCRYVERNALRAGLVARAEDWQWGSAWVRKYGSEAQKKILSTWPIEIPDEYDSSLNEDDDSDEAKEELSNVRRSLNHAIPLGNNSWVSTMVKKFKLQATMRPPGRPRKLENGT